MQGGVGMQRVVEQLAGGVARSVVEGHEPVAGRCLQRVLHAPEGDKQGFRGGHVVVFIREIARCLAVVDSRSEEFVVAQEVEGRLSGITCTGS